MVSGYSDGADAVAPRAVFRRGIQGETGPGFGNDSCVSWKLISEAVSVVMCSGWQLDQFEHAIDAGRIALRGGFEVMHEFSRLKNVIIDYSGAMQDPFVIRLK